MTNYNTNAVKSKVCTKCEVEFEATTDNFCKSKLGKYGLESVCKQCGKEYRRLNSERKRLYDKLYVDENREIITKRQTEYNLKHVERKRLYDKRRRDGVGREDIIMKKAEYYRENKDAIAIKSREYYINNKDAKRRYDKRYKAENKEATYLKNKEWRENNREKDRLSKQRYKARKLNLEHDFTTCEWEECKVYFNKECAYCGVVDDLAQEHFIPVSKGGGYVVGNILPSCKSCNSQKHAIDFFEWYPNHSGYSMERENKIIRYLNEVDELKAIHYV